MTGDTKAKTEIVFVVTSGEYSDYTIEAIFGEESDANNWMDLNGCDRVEHVIFNPHCNTAPKLECFEIDIQGEKRKLFYKRLPKLCDGKTQSEFWYRTWKDSHPTSINFLEKSDDRYWLHWTGYAESEDIAKEIVKGVMQAIDRGERPEGLDMGNN